MRETERGVNLGKLQAQHEASAKALSAAERALKRAQDARDVAKAQALSAEAALRNGARTVLG